MELKETVEGMLSLDYKERFRSEYAQVYIRHCKLNTMLFKHSQGTLEFTPACPISLLAAQNALMVSLLNILELRAEIEGIDLSDISERMEER